MSYIGKEPQFTQYPSKFFNGDGTAMTVTLDYAPPNEAALLVFIDGVRQDTGAYSVTGTSLTFSGAVPSGTANVQVVHLGIAVDVGVPGVGTVTDAQVSASAAIADTKISLGTAIQAYDADTAKTDVAQTYTAAQRAEVTALTSGTNISIDFADSNNFSVTLAHNATFDNPTNIVAGQSGSIFITQDGTGSRTGSWGSYWDFAGGTAPTLTTTASAVDRVDYVVLDSTNIHAVATLNYS
jgi:hypothetical protein